MKPILIIVSLLLLTRFINGIDYALPYLTFGGSPSYYLSNQAFSNNGFGILENDAHRVSVSRFNVGVFHTTLYESLMANSAVVSVHFNKTSVSVSAIRIAESNMNKTSIDTSLPDNPFRVSGTYNYQNSVAKLSVNHSFNDRLTLGAGVNAYITSLDSDSGTGFDGSLGAILNGKWIDISLSLHNITQRNVVYNDNSKETLPRLAIASMDINPIHWLHIYPRLILINSTYDNKESQLLSCGLSWVPYKYFSITGSIYEQQNGLDKDLRFSIGTHINLTGLMISYAFRTTDYHNHVGSHLISLSFGL